MNEGLLTKLEATPDRLAAELEELPESELVRRPPDGGWNLKELAGHMAFAEKVWGAERLSRILSEDNPELPLHDEHQDIETSAWGTRPIREALNEWRNFREQTVATLRGLSEEDLRRTGRHPERGEMTSLDVAEYLSDHDEGHYAQALELKGLSREPSS